MAPAAYTQGQLAAARDVIIDALRQGPNPQSYAQLAGNTQLERTLVVIAASRLVIEEHLSLEPGDNGILVWLAE